MKLDLTPWEGAWYNKDVETQMVDKGEISAVRVIVPEGQDIQTTETLQMQIRYQPKGKIREFVIDLGMENPYAS